MDGLRTGGISWQHRRLVGFSPLRGWSMDHPSNRHLISTKHLLVRIVMCLYSCNVHTLLSVLMCLIVSVFNCIYVTWRTPRLAPAIGPSSINKYV